MIALLIVAAGLCIIFGAKDLAGRILKIAGGLILVLSVVPSLIGQCAPPELGNSDPPPALGLVALVLVLGLVGFIAWKSRAARERRQEILRKRHGAPRERALPAPAREEDDQ